MMNESCPWSQLKPAVLTFCEAHRCAWVQEPLNAFSNLGFVFVGLYLLRKHRTSSEMMLFGLAALFVGLTSGFYHASSSFIGELFDLCSMYLLVVGMIFFNLNRMNIVTTQNIIPKALGVSFLGILLILIKNELGSYIFNSLVGLVFLSEFFVYKHLKKKQQGPLPYRYQFYWLAILSHTTGYGFWLLDYHKIHCNPESLLFHGHAVWHLLSAVTFLMLARFYGQFYDGSTIKKEMYV